MSPDDLQNRFEQALRRALTGTPDAPGAVHVAAPNVTVTPTIKATLPAPDGPLPVQDIGRFGGAFEYEVKIERTGDGYIKTARLVPTTFHPFVIENER